MPRKALRCVLQLELRSVTCPGVLLKDKQELYLSVFVLGQYKKTQCVPAVFPLFFQEKLVFEKAFANIVDPGDLVKLLEFDTATLELIQLVPPVGKVLATYEENTRDFLFPDPKLTHGHRGLEREILMKRSPFFTGIAPKLRFSTISLISDSLLSSGRSHIQADTNWVHHSTPKGKMHSKLPKKNPPPSEKDRQSSAVKSYEQPTIASKSRSPSPYTKRRMCELSEEARQRLAHLNLGPHEFRRDTDKPPFVIRRVCICSKVGQPSPGAKLHTWCSPRESTAEAWTKAPSDPSPLASYRPKKAEAKSTRGKGLGSSAASKEDVSSDPPNRESHSAASLEHPAPPAVQEPSLTSVLNRSSLRESSPAQQNTPVHLGNGECWSAPAAVYKEKPHRAILEESLGKIYRNMYEKAAGAVSDQDIQLTRKQLT
ncbi:spermatogenesis-associated protein 6 isoform X3 [Corvus hawaiiensis]|uniref:spermatogenesis-associated protein 6 isoform X3 n=1 Tax=Corvus hawaiiensis TaxID=134902 RepID=UPI002019DFD2|nr:spermatogenesis-associated protein 6 isoform X3 [Corvus hawaiiensis]